MSNIITLDESIVVQRPLHEVFSYIVHVAFYGGK